MFLHLWKRPSSFQNPPKEHKFKHTIKQPAKIEIGPALKYPLELTSADNAQNLQMKILEMQPCLSSQQKRKPKKPVIRDSQMD